MTRIRKLSTHYIRICLFSIVFLLGILTLFGYFTWKKYQCSTKHKCQNAIFQIERIISKNFKEAKNLLFLIGKEISREDPKNIHRIASHLKLIDSKELEIEPNFSWSFLDWIDADGWLHANSRQGALDSKIKVTKKQRIYISEAVKHPWELIVCPPSIGNQSGTRIIPTGMGVLNKDKEFIGIVAGGVNISRLNQIIDHTLLSFPIKFLITDREMNVAFHSSNLEGSSLLARKLFANFSCLEQDDYAFDTPLNIQSTLFFHYRNIKDTPYYLFVGIDKTAFQNDLYFLFFKKFIEFFCLIIFFIIFLFIFWKKQIFPVIKLSNFISDENIKITNQSCYEIKIIQDRLKKTNFLLKEREKNLIIIKNFQKEKNDLLEKIKFKEQQISNYKSQLDQINKLSRESELSYEKFIYEIDQKFGKTFKKVISLGNILLNNLTGSLDFPVTEDKEFEILDNIMKNIHFIQTSIPHYIDFSKNNLKSVIEECLNIFSFQIFLRKIQVHVNLKNCPSFVHLDKIHFKQIIISLISKSISNVLDNGVIEIYAKNVINGKNHFIELMFKDNGFGLSEQDIYRLENKFNLNEVGFFNLKNLSFRCIQKIVELHKGTIQFNSEWKNGTCITISFPIFLDNCPTKKAIPTSREF